MKMKLFGAALATTLGAASMASAAVTSVTVQSAGIYDSDQFLVTGTINNQAFSETETGGIIRLTGVYTDTSVSNSPIAFDVDSFCFNLLVHVTTAVNQQTDNTTPDNPYPITYDVAGGMSSNSSGLRLTSAQITYLASLSVIGSNDDAFADNSYGLSGNTLIDEPAIQAAIWHAEYGVNPTFTDTTADGTTTIGAEQEAQYEELLGLKFAPLNNPSLTDINSQDVAVGLVNSGDFPYTVGQPLAAPEPASWALMLVGIGGMGAMLRRRRATVLAAA